MDEDTDEYPELVDWRTADHRGRVNLGPEFAEKRVKIAVIEVEGGETDS